MAALQAFVKDWGSALWPASRLAELEAERPARGALAEYDRAKSDEERAQLGERFLRDHPRHPRAGAIKARLEKIVTLGWSGERLPKGLRRGAAKPVYVYDTGKGLEIELVYVPPGKFKMGSESGDEKPQHDHDIKNGYWIGRTEVTWGQFLAFCKAKGQASHRRRAGA